MADAKNTPAYSLDLNILRIIMQLLDLWWQYQSDLAKSENCYIGVTSQGRILCKACASMNVEDKNYTTEQTSK